jgi:hypothetical protein
LSELFHLELLSPPALPYTPKAQTDFNILETAVRVESGQLQQLDTADAKKYSLDLKFGRV